MCGINNSEDIDLHKLVIIIIIILLILQYNISRQTKMATFTETARQVPRHIVYGRNLRKQEYAYMEIKPGVFALLNCNHTGKLTKKYVIVQQTVPVCSCGESECLHIREVRTLAGPHDPLDDDQTEEFECEFLTQSLVAVFCRQQQSYGILRKGVSNTCLTCSSNVRNCPHVYVFMSYMASNQQPQPQNIREREVFTPYSTKLIPWFLKDDKDLEVFEGYVSNRAMYPTDLYPNEDVTLKCIHGNFYSSDLLKLRDGYLYLQHHTQSVSIYYRPVMGACKCRLHYDGRSDLLFNLDNKHIFSFVWLYTILHNTQFNHYTLYGAFQEANATRLIGRQEDLSLYIYNKLRLAYNCFLKQLDLNYEEILKCDEPECGEEPALLVMDGTSIGGRKDLLPPVEATAVPEQKVKGSTIEQRLFIREESPRILLAKYANLSTHNDLLASCSSTST